MQYCSYRQQQRLRQVLDKATARLSDEVVNTESNLWPVVVRKNLYKLGLDHSQFDAHDGSVCQLLNRRNDIAHGRARDGFDDRTYNKLQSDIFTMMEDLMESVTKAMEQSIFRKAV